MLKNDLKNPNSDTQSMEVLNQENAPKKSEEFALWKRGVLLAIGLVGLEVTAIIVTFLCIGIPASDRSADHSRSARRPFSENVHNEALPDARTRSGHPPVPLPRSARTHCLRSVQTLPRNRLSVPFHALLTF